ncbi:hypothetical protein D3C87_1131160 [compost metagenome]
MRRSDEHDKTRLGVGHGCLPGGHALARDDVHQAAGRSTLLAEKTQNDGAERRQFGGLDDDRVASTDGGRDLPSAGVQRCVPRRDLYNHADRFLACVVEMGSRNGNDVAMQLVAPSGVIFEHLCDFDDFATDIADRTASRAAFDFSDVGRMFADRACDLVHDPSAAGGGELHPCALRSGGGIHCAVHHRTVGVFVCREGFAAGGIGKGELFARTEDNLTINETADLFGADEGLEDFANARTRIADDIYVAHNARP